MKMDVHEVEHKEVPKCEYKVCKKDLVGCECSKLEMRRKLMQSVLSWSWIFKGMSMKHSRPNLRPLEVDMLDYT
jgi:hypothetical protein